MEGIKALAFDTGGTVLDWHSGIVGAFAEAGGRHGVDRDWHEIANDYRRRSLQRMLGCVNPGFNIDDVHREILDAMITAHDLAMFSTVSHDAGTSLTLGRTFRRRSCDFASAIPSCPSRSSVSRWSSMSHEKTASIGIV
jgi:hypothetical protein